jgi:hypothetical protein
MSFRSRWSKACKEGRPDDCDAMFCENPYHRNWK